VWLTIRPETESQAGGNPPPSAAPAPSATAASAPAAAPTGDSASTPAGRPSGTATSAGNGPTPVRPTLPNGWRDYRDPTGFSVYVPEGWTRSKKGSIVYFRSRGRVLGIDQTRKPQWDPVADWRGKADYRVRRGDFPSYREVHIKKVDYFLEAADWEFTFNRSGTRQHVNNRGFITARTQAYGIYWQTTDAAWNAAEDDLQLVFDSFRPARR
jgi:hypothetical protein